MNLEKRISLLERLGKYMLSNEATWQEAKQKASVENGWFIPEFVEHAVRNTAEQFLGRAVLEDWVRKYQIPSTNENPSLVGIVMAGNIPMVGFHDLLCSFISGHKSAVKASSRDSVLIRHLIEKMQEWEPGMADLVTFSERLNKCDAYIATGSNNSAGYFEYYFKKYPHIIRKNRTSVAILSGDETTEDLTKLADDVYLYFGLGCRNVTKIYVPEGYDFIPLLSAFRKYDYLFDHHKYKNNLDYNLAIHLLNKKIYMSNKSLMLIEEKSPFSPISQLNYEHYSDQNQVVASLVNNPDIQCIVGQGFVGFGDSQRPSISDYADRVDTLHFLVNLHKIDPVFR